MNKIELHKPAYSWLFGGMGFHNNEATMYKLMSQEFFNQRVAKTFREIAPTFSRVFAGYADWTKSAMDAFADYYEQTFKRADTTIYMVPGRILLHFTQEEREEHAENTAKNLAYLINERGVRHIRYFCLTNELAVGNEHGRLAKDLPLFAEYHRLLYRAFRRYGLRIGLVATDHNFNEIEWALKNMDEVTDVYCAHDYSTGGMEPGDPAFYKYVYDMVNAPSVAVLKREKRFMLGEYGIGGNNFNSVVMRNDVTRGYGDPEQEAVYALMAAEKALAAMNAGALAVAKWSFCDYPDPFLKVWGESEAAQNAYEAGRFSGHGTDIRYNKWGLFRWNDEGNYSPHPPLFCVGLLTKYFRQGARVLEWACRNDAIRCGGVVNPDGSVSIAVINWSSEAADTGIEPDFAIGRPMRVYTYETSVGIYNPFGDLQGYGDVIGCENGAYRLRLPASSLTILTNDYEERTPCPVPPDCICLKDGTLSWDASKDEKHCYYRVFRDGVQIGSTVGESFPVGSDAPESSYCVRSVDRYGNFS